MRQNDINFQPDELRCELGEAFASSLRPAIFDRNGASFDPAEFVKSPHESGGQLALPCWRSRPKEADGRQLRLLRARQERPRYCRAAEKCDELPPPHGAYPKAKDHGRSIAGVDVGQWRASQ